jgi:hypothetical protein
MEKMGNLVLLYIYIYIHSTILQFVKCQHADGTRCMGEAGLDKYTLLTTCEILEQAVKSPCSNCICN